MNRETKASTVEELKQTLSKVQSLIIADYKGLSVEQVNGLRREIRKADCKYRVVKNTLFKRAIAGTPMEHLSPLFKGTTAISWSTVDPVAPAKVMDKAASTLEKLNIKGGYLDGKVLNAVGVKALATMKGKDDLRAELLATFMAPAQGFVRLLAAAPMNFLYLLQAREREAAQSGGTAVESGGTAVESGGTAVEAPNSPGSRPADAPR